MLKNNNLQMEIAGLSTQKCRSNLTVDIWHFERMFKKYVKLEKWEKVIDKVERKQNKKQ